MKNRPEWDKARLGMSLFISVRTAASPRKAIDCTIYYRIDEPEVFVLSLVIVSDKLVFTNLLCGYNYLFLTLLVLLLERCLRLEIERQTKQWL